MVMKSSATVCLTDCVEEEQQMMMVYYYVLFPERVDGWMSGGLNEEGI